MKNSRKPVILNVDDTEAMRYTTTRILQQAGFEVREAATGREALRLAEECPDLILLDVRLPDISGIEVCKQIRANPRLSAIPVVHLSAVFMSNDDRVTGLEQGADGYLTQPVYPKILVATINAFLRLKFLLEENEQLAREWQLTFNSVADAVWILDADQRVVRSNRGAERIFQRATDEMIGKHCWEIVHGTQAPILECPILRMRKTLKRESMELQADDRWFKVTVDPILDADKHLSGAVHIVSDITERKQAEAEQTLLQAQLHQAQKMESVGRLAGGVAHDFNNMLTIILSYTQLVIDRIDPAGTVHDDLQQVLKAAQRSVDITRQLLAFARKQTVSPQVLDLNQTVESMLKMLRRLIGEDIHLTWRPRSGLGPVKIDPSQMDQILANLCVNARDAIAGVGEVTLETDNVIFDGSYCAAHPGYVPGDFVLLAVSDTGCGMDRQTLDHIFEPFFTTKDLGQGTGLGLATVYGIVKQNDGFINVYSEPGKGTTFRIYLPRHAGDPQQSKLPDETEIPRGHHETVLIIEDDVPILNLVKRMLEGLDYEALEAATPGQAMNLAQTHIGGIDLVLTDVIMPEMTGPDLAKKLKALYPDLKILFMSGYTADIIAQRGLLPEDVHFVSKPFSRKELAVKIRETLDHEPV